MDEGQEIDRFRESMRIGEWVLHADRNELEGPEETVRLEPRTCAVLVALAERAGAVCSREALLDQVWGGAFVGEGVLTHSIWDLRRTFGDNAKKPRYIQTVPRRGYRLVADVAPAAGQGASAQGSLANEASAAGEAAPAPGELSAPVLRALFCARGAGLDSWSAQALAEHGGRTVESRDDERLAVFERPIQAVGFALDWHAALRALGAREASESAVSCAIHFGEVVPEVASAVPQSIRIAASLAALATAGQTLLSRSAFDLARNAETLSGPQPVGAELSEAEGTEAAGSGLRRALRSDLLRGGERWLAHGTFQLDSLDRPIEVFEVGLDGVSPLTPPAERPGVRRLHGDGVVVGWRPAPGLEVPLRPNWCIERKLGEGGFGEVWLCRQAKTGEARVFKFCYELDRLRALQREVTLFRLLKESLGERRDIARILDWNFEEAPYFLEMEYSADGSLLDWSKEIGGITTLPLALRVEIAAQVADALSAAHSVGVLHKDVKPANILVRRDVEGRPRACLTDFGIGRLTDRDRLEAAAVTALGFSESVGSESSSGSGTRLYMAPEVLEGKAASTQADLYSLGVVLFQLLAGDLSRALAPGWRRDLEATLAEGGSEVDGVGPGAALGLEARLWIEDVAACVDGSPARRLSSAAELAQRLRTVRERAAELRAEAQAVARAAARRRDLEHARRRRKTWSAIAVAALVVLAVVSLFAVQARQAHRAAEEARERAEGLVGFLLGDLHSTLAGVGRLDAMESTSRRVLEHYDAIDPNEMSGESLERRIRALQQIGSVRIEVGALEEALATFEASQRLAEGLAARGFVPSHQALLADGHYWLGYVAVQQGRLEPAVEAFCRHRDLYAELVERVPEDRDYRLELAYGASNLGAVRQRQGMADAALERFRECLAQLEGLAQEQPEDRALLLELATSHHQIGQTLESLGQLTGALAAYRDDLAIVRRLAQEESAAGALSAPLRVRRATAEASTGRALLRLGDLGGALEAYGREVEDFAALGALDPGNARWQRHLAVARARRAHALRWRGQLEEATVLIEQARSALDAMVARDPAQVGWQRDLIRALVFQADIALAAERPGAAVAAIESAAARVGGLRAGSASTPSALRPEDEASVDLLHAAVLDAVLLEIEPGAPDPPTGPEALRQRAFDRLQAAADGARDPEILALWVQALLATERREEARAVADRLAVQGYREPSYLAACRRWNLPARLPASGSQGPEGGSTGILGSQ